MAEKKEILVVHETIWHSIVKDVVTLLQLALAVLVGIWLDSRPLQWIGIFLWLYVTYHSASKLLRPTMTVAEARKRLDEIERGEATQ